MKKTQRLWIAAILGGIYIATCSVIDLGFQVAFIRGITFFIGLALIIGFVFNLIQNFAAALIPIFFFTLWLKNTGARHPAADLTWALIIFFWHLQFGSGFCGDVLIVKRRDGIVVSG